MTDDELMVLRQIVQHDRNISDVQRAEWATKIDQHRDDLKKQKIAYDADVAAYKAEVKSYKQMMWDAYALLGYDTDGDPTPDAVVGWPQGFIPAVTGAVQTHHEVCNEAETLAREVRALQADPYQTGRNAGFDEGYAVAEREFSMVADQAIAILRPLCLDDDL